LQRRLDFRRLAVIDASTSLASPVAAVAFALAGLDGEAIVLGLIASASVGAVLGLVYSPPGRPAWSGAEMREIAAYGTPAAGSSLLYTAVRNIDYVILAARLPAAVVGYYVRAFQLGSEYQSKISGILLRVAFPVFSRSQDATELRRVRARMVRVHAAVLFPLLFGLIAVAPVFVPFLYGEDWAPAASLTQILAIGGMVAAIGTGTGPLLLATGHPRALLLYNLAGFVAYVAAVLVAIPHGIVAVCWAVVAVRLVSFAFLQWAVVERLVGIPFLETVRDDALPAVAAGVLQLAVTWLGVQGLESASFPTALVLVLPGLAGLAVYLLVLRTCFRDTWHDLVLLFRRLTIRRPKLTRTRLRAGFGEG
jgi:O-antigen/teichoic acid export membrane protein